VEPVGGGDDHGVQLVGGLGAGLHGAPASDLQQSDRLDVTGSGLRRDGRFARQDGSRRADGVSRVGLGVTAAVLPVRSGHLDDRHRLAGEVSGEASPPRPGAFNADLVDVIEAAQPTQ
jgi:hypothetical protein